MNFKFNKKIIIPIAILLVFLLVFSLFLNIKKKKNKALTEDVMRNEMTEGEKQEESQSTEKDDEELSENKENEEELEDILSENESINTRILAFGKDDGVLTLYNEDGKVIDFLDLKTLDRDVSEVLDLKEGKPIITNEELIKSIEEQIAKEVEGEDKEALKKILEKYLEEKEEDNLDNEEEKREGFRTFRTVSNDLILHNLRNNSLIHLRAKDETIMASILLRDVNLDGLTSVEMYNGDIYLTFEGDNHIYKINKTNGKLNKEKYELDNIPYFVFAEKDSLYYVSKHEIGKMNINNLDLSEDIKTVKANIGDYISSFHQDKNYIYLISEFGKDSGNSVLLKVKKSNLEVVDMMELKGINSVFIGTNKNLAYIRQKDSIKEVDLNALSPKTAIARKEGTPVQVINNKLYLLEDGLIKIFNIDTSKKIKEFPVDGFTFQLF